MYDGPIIDCDVHHARSSDEELLPYLSPGWREYVSDRGPAGMVPLTVQDGLPNPHGFMRIETYPENGGPPGSDFATLKRQVLERGDVRRAILTFGDDSHVAGHHNPYFAAELARALNDWSVERWLCEDARIASSILVASQLPDLAAAEIRGMPPIRAWCRSCSSTIRSTTVSAIRYFIRSLRPHRRLDAR
jgi:hypothetical protein